MFKLLLFLFISLTIRTHPVFAQNQALKINISFAYNSDQFLGLQNEHRYSDNGTAKLDVRYDTNNSSSQLALNYNGYDSFTLDRSYLQYTSGIATFGVGAIDRHWSFSDKTSLILSHNARPFKSVYLKLNNRFSNSWVHTKAKWSFEVFNGFTKDPLNINEPMLLGARAVLSPFEGLDFELVQTSQWGGKNYSSGVSALGSAIIFDTNKNSNSNINKMAGFGISYLIPNNQIPLRIYGQAIGEDEAGNLPSCYAHLAGLEWSSTKIKYPTTVGIEAVDTRIDLTSNGNCGANTMYNNHIYSYTNRGDTMGAAIDTESNSLEFFGQTQLSQKVNVKYSTKLVTINDSNWPGHRLSSKRQSGLINSLGISWVKNETFFNAQIYNQGFSLDKKGINSVYGFGFLSAIKF